MTTTPTPRDEAAMNAERRKPHICTEDDVCCCYLTDLEPHPKCPVHSGYREWPPRCASCGRFTRSAER